MLQMIAAQVLRRRGRSLAVVAAIVVAAVSFSLLTSAVATSKLQVKGTVEANYRTAYDILVRPPGSTTSLERTERLVRQNFLSDIFGGITMAQYRQIQEMPGVDVAAPVAMIGYMLPSLYLPIRVDALETSNTQQIFRVSTASVAQRGLSVYPGGTGYIYVTRQRLDFSRNGIASQQDPISGTPVRVCQSFTEQVPVARSAFDQRAVELACYSTQSVAPGSTGLPGVARGEEGVFFDYPFPVLLAAVDPVQESRLVGLRQAMVAGRYLRSDERPRLKSSRPEDPDSLKYRQVPVMMANRTLIDEKVRIDIRQLDISQPRQVPGRLAADDASAWLENLSGRLVRRSTVKAASLYPQLLEQYSSPKAYLAQAQYWSSGPVSYGRSPDGHLQPVPRRNPPSTWTDLRSGFNAPPDDADVGFRKLQVHLGSNAILPVDGKEVYASPIVRSVGAFDPAEIQGFSRLSQVPLTTYYPPAAAPGDQRTSELLGGKSLLPDANLAGYLQSPPLMLTNLRSLGAFTSSSAFSDTTKIAKAPISVIRVRVAGVTGVDKLSQARVRLAAEQIIRQTGLEVDVTIGSSPTPQMIDLPAGKFGRPPLTLQEDWVRKGVAVQLLKAIDAKSLALFLLVLIVCLLFLVNATVAAIRTRRPELGVLACLGWPARRIFALLEAELVVTGLVAGLVGSGIAATLVRLFHLQVSWWQLAAIIPVATALAALAGVGPAWRACHATPLEAITPAVRAPRKAARVSSISHLAMVGIARWPGRTVLGAASLFVGVAALAVLIAIQVAFQGGVVGTALGDVVAVQVRGVDYLAVALTIGLGAFAVADIAYLNISERVSEIGTLRASGWGEFHLRRLFGMEALVTASLGAVTGAAVGVTTAALVLPISLRITLFAAGGAAAVGLVAALLALIAPLARLSRLAPAAAITTE